MKKYKVNVNGTMYEITLEVVDEAEAPKAPAAPAPKASPAPAAAPAGGTKVASPMPGTILAVNVTVGLADLLKKTVVTSMSIQNLSLSAMIGTGILIWTTMMIYMIND